MIYIKRKTKKISLVILCLIMQVFSIFDLFPQSSLMWESPQLIIPAQARFPRVASSGKFVSLVYEEFIPKGTTGGEIYLHLWVSDNLLQWKKKPRFAGPIPYIDKEIQIFSLAMDNEGDIYIAVSTAPEKVTLYYSKDQGRTFFQTEITTEETTISPRIFIRDEKTFYLFVAYATESSLSIHYLVLTDSIFTSSEIRLTFAPFVTEPEFGFNYLPYFCRHNGKDFVVFQTRLAGETTGFQLYLKSSPDGGKTWSQALNITALSETINNTNLKPEDFSNQRAYLSSINGKLYIAWERQATGASSQIAVATIDDAGKMSDYERITSSGFSCYFPQLVFHNNVLYALWFDNQHGDDHIKIAEKSPNGWREKDLSSGIPGSSEFAQPVTLSGFLYIFWENRYGAASRLYLLEPDQSVNSPRISPLNFISGRPQKDSIARIAWTVPEDSSGISGFRYAWYKKGQESRKEIHEVYKDVTHAELAADDDGAWIFSIQAGDYAGNWSEAVDLLFIRDTTPPGKIVFHPPDFDSDGFFISNTFNIDWEPPQDKDVAGYAYSLEYLSSDLQTPYYRFDEKMIRKPGTAIQVFGHEKGFTNLDDGIYAFSVRALDEVGNYGDPVMMFFKLDKYVPYTYISYIGKDTDSSGQTTIKIIGRGFTSDGTITSIYLDRDGKPPYDYTFELSKKSYRIAGDGLIDSLRIPDVKEGDYKLGLFHEKRGIFFSQILLSLEPNLIVIKGPFPPEYVPEWEKTQKPIFIFGMNDFILILLLLLLAIALVASFKKLAGVIREGQFIEAEVIAIMTGIERKEKREKHMKRLRAKGFGLRFKFASLSTVLVIIIILMISVTLSYYMIRTQTNILADGLFQRVRVLLGSISSGTEKSLPLQNMTELAILLDQKNAMDEAESITITGITKRDSTQPSDKEYVWATNDPDIAKKIDTKDYITGESILDDKEVSTLVSDLAKEINKKAVDEVSALAQEVNKYTKEATELAGKTDAVSRQRFAELRDAVDVKGRTLTDKLHQISFVIGSYPKFDMQNLKKSYTFYKPVVYRLGDNDIYFRGVVRMKVSTIKILKTIDDSRNQLIFIIMFISLIAIGLGIAGAILLASITISPIKKLALGVAKIRDTDDKSLLKDHLIDIRQKDEIRTLADTINQMTQGLVKAAMASKDLTIGKEVQKMFIPLELDSMGKKGTTGHDSNAYIDIFGYYEGAKGVSGDYFDFVKLGDEHYGFIKCDVAGKGVPAALIMVEVATIFIDYFRNWTPKEPGLKTDRLVAKINDLIEERGFKGRFAALIVGIINFKTGVCYLCNAGDNIIHIFVQNKGQVVEKSLPVAPAAGVFPSSIVEMQTGYKQVSEKLATGDVLFLLSDGFDEAKRHFRNVKAEIVICDDPSLKDGEEHLGTHKKGEDGEVLGMNRVADIIRTIWRKERFTLVKAHYPFPDEEFSFDFSNADDTLQNTVLGLVSVEKVFRVYRKNNATEDDKVIVDKKVDELLSKHFVQYKYYFKNRVELPDNPQYVCFTHLNEDEQYDDLTLLAIRKK